MGELKLKAAFDEIMATAIKRQHRGSEPRPLSEGSRAGSNFDQRNLKKPTVRPGRTVLMS
jgi:hypothetical protein